MPKWIFHIVVHWKSADRLSVFYAFQNNLAYDFKKV